MTLTGGPSKHPPALTTGTTRTLRLEHALGVLLLGHDTDDDLHAFLQTRSRHFRFLSIRDADLHRDEGQASLLVEVPQTIAAAGESAEPAAHHAAAHAAAVGTLESAIGPAARDGAASRPIR